MGARLVAILLDSSMLSWSGNRNGRRTPQIMTVYRLLAPKEVEERSVLGCQEGSPIIVDLLVACRREERASDVDRSVFASSS